MNMTDSEGEIECLDEDADIVYQCMKFASENKEHHEVTTGPYKEGLLQEQSSEKRKRLTYEDDDSDYDPSEERPPAPKRRSMQTRQSVKFNKIPPLKRPTDQTVDRSKRPNLTPDPIIRRKQMEIIIPDFEDPLCLPVKAVVRDNLDASQLNKWNNQCITQMRERSNCMKTSKGDAVSSSRTVVLRTVTNRFRGKNEVNVQVRTSIKDESGHQESEVLNCTLPRFREKKELTYWLTDQRVKSKKSGTPTTRTTVILTAEEDKDDERMVAYNLEDATTAVYSLIENPESETDCSSSRYKRHLLERAACRSCARCHQAARRPAAAARRASKDMSCCICNRNFVSIYNYLTHMKTHSAGEVARYSKIISKALSEVVEYHYKCRICQRKFPGIKHLRSHLKTHNSNEPFLCEIGNHLVK